MTERIYDTMIRQVREIMDVAHGVILDATFSKRTFRDRLRATLGDANVKWIVAETDEATTHELLKLRDSLPDVISDARSEDQDLLNNAFASPDELPEADRCFVMSNGGADEVAGRALATLATKFSKKHD